MHSLKRANRIDTNIDILIEKKKAMLEQKVNIYAKGRNLNYSRLAYALKVEHHMEIKFSLLFLVDEFD